MKPLNDSELRENIAIRVHTAVNDAERADDLSIEDEVDGIMKLIKADRLAIFTELRDSLPEKKQQKYFLETTPKTMMTEESRDRFYRYGGYDFAIGEVIDLINQMIGKVK